MPRAARTIRRPGGSAPALSTSQLKRGTYTVTATYSGDVNFTTSSGGMSLTVTA